MNLIKGKPGKLILPFTLISNYQHISHIRRFTRLGVFFTQFVTFTFTREFSNGREMHGKSAKKAKMQQKIFSGFTGSWSATSYLNFSPAFKRAFFLLKTVCAVSNSCMISE